VEEGCPQEEVSQGALKETPEPQAVRDEVPRTQEPKGTVLALGAINPVGDIDLGCTQKPDLVVVRPKGRRGRPPDPGEKPRWFGLTLKTQRGGPGLCTTTPPRHTSGRAWRKPVVPVCRPSTERPSSWAEIFIILPRYGRLIPLGYFAFSFGLSC